MHWRWQFVSVACGFSGQWRLQSPFIDERIEDEPRHPEREPSVTAALNILRRCKNGWRRAVDCNEHGANCATLLCSTAQAVPVVGMVPQAFVNVGHTESRAEQKSHES